MDSQEVEKRKEEYKSAEKELRDFRSSHFVSISFGQPQPTKAITPEAMEKLERLKSRVESTRQRLLDLGVDPELV